MWSHASQVWPQHSHVEEETECQRKGQNGIHNLSCRILITYASVSAPGSFWHSSTCMVGYSETLLLTGSLLCSWNAISTQQVLYFPPHRRRIRRSAQRMELHTELLLCLQLYSQIQLFKAPKGNVPKLHTHFHLGKQKEFPRQYKRPICPELQHCQSMIPLTRSQTLNMVLPMPF